uniref:GPI alpha-1,4-mannosyltransferase I, catalytic subunit n=1 Tax=Heligmosomoides polygyrus TaxID=6339 RepID=A0A8L8JZY2_HELPZ
LPNNSYKDFGKYLFCIFDIIVGWLYFQIMSPTEQTEQQKGSGSRKTEREEDADGWVTKSWIAAAIVHGALAVHLKIYPVIYLPSIFLHLGRFSSCPCIFASLKQLFANWKGFMFAAISLVCFGLIVAFFYLVYGDVFLEEFLLYHIKRRDIQHNFSPYFYLLRLVDDDENLSRVLGFLAFLPQMGLVLYFAFKYHNDLPFCWFMSTFAFVTFNKVCTSQYFVWYVTLLPLVTDRFKLTLNETLTLIGMWFASQGVWLFFAYLYEFRRWRTLEYVWASSILFLIVNCYIMGKLKQRYQAAADTSVKRKDD